MLNPNNEPTGNNAENSESNERYEQYLSAIKKRGNLALTITLDEFTALEEKIKNNKNLDLPSLSDREIQTYKIINDENLKKEKKRLEGLRKSQITTTNEIEPNRNKVSLIIDKFKNFINNENGRNKGIKAVFRGAAIAAIALVIGTQAGIKTTSAEPTPPQSTTENEITYDNDKSLEDVQSFGDTIVYDNDNTLDDQNQSDATTSESAEVLDIENTDLTGELLSGVLYSYVEFADYANKGGREDFGHDKTHLYNDEEGTRQGIIEMARENPENLSAYSMAFFEYEKERLGIGGVSENELDDYLSDENHKDGGELQRKVLKAFEEKMNSKDKTRIVFVNENGLELSRYIYYTDENGDGKITPSEATLKWDEVQRNNAKQAEVWCLNEQTGEWEKVLDLNMDCGFQPNLEIGRETKIPHVPVVTSETPEKKIITSRLNNPEDGEEGGELIFLPGQPYEKGEKDDTPDTSGHVEHETPVKPTPTPDEKPTPETPAQKSYKNLERIDNQILEDKANDIGTEKVVVTPTKEVSQADLTEKPSADNYEGTEATIVENTAASGATSVQEQVTTPENDYSDNLGGANANEYAPVQENQEAQTAADEAEVPVSEAPGVEDIGSTEMNDILSDLGIE